VFSVGVGEGGEGLVGGLGDVNAVEVSELPPWRRPDDDQRLSPVSPLTITVQCGGGRVSGWSRR